METHPETLARWRLGFDRYEKVRKLNLRQWGELHERNLAGENFDGMIDALGPASSTRIIDADLAAMTAKGAKAWADVPDATAWVDDLRGNAPAPECNASVLAERERCALLAEQLTYRRRWGHAGMNDKAIAPCEIAAAIRKP